LESNKNICVEEETLEQPEQSGSRRSTKRDRVRRRRSCETEVGRRSSNLARVIHSIE